MSIKHGLFTAVIVLVIIFAVSKSPFAATFGLQS
jgi:hypothetical protein